jgi:hypothetical protein
MAPGLRAHQPSRSVSHRRYSRDHARGTRHADIQLIIIRNGADHDPRRRFRPTDRARPDRSGPSRTAITRIVVSPFVAFPGPKGSSYRSAAAGSFNDS